MKKLFIVLGVLVMIVVAIAFSYSPGKVYADTWTRYETSNGASLNTTNFLFSPVADWIIYQLAAYSGGSLAYALTPGDNVSFNFTGTQFRIIAYLGFNRSNNIEVNIDGTSYYFSEYSSVDQWQAIAFDSINYVSLASGQHHVIITAKATGLTDVDAIEVFGTLNAPPIPTPTSTPTTTPTPTPTTSPNLCYGNLIVGTLGAYNPGTIYQNSRVTQTYTVSGVELGDFVQVSFEQDLQGIMLYGYVSAVDQVTVVFQNSTTSSITLASGTVRIRVTGHTSP